MNTTNYKKISEIIKQHRKLSKGNELHRLDCLSIDLADYFEFEDRDRLKEVRNPKRFYMFDRKKFSE